MLGFAPLAAAPLGASGEAGIAYDVSFSDAATITDGGVVGLPVYAGNVSEASSGAMSAVVTASIFNAVASFGVDITDNPAALAIFEAATSDGSTGSDAASAFIGFLVSVSESGTATDSALVEASEFNATASDAADMTDTARTSAVMNSAVSNAAEIDDADSASYLWNLINNAQATSWTVVKTEN